MVAEEEYDLVPHSRLDNLEKEVSSLKGNPLGSTQVGSDLLNEIKDLNKNIKSLLNLFKDATEEMKLEEKDTQTFGKRFEPMVDKIDTLIDQNKKIAKGIIAVADMIKETLESHSTQKDLEKEEWPQGGNHSMHGLMSQSPGPRPAGVPPPSFGAPPGPPPMPPPGQMMPRMPPPPR